MSRLRVVAPVAFFLLLSPALARAQGAPEPASRTAAPAPVSRTAAAPAEPAARQALDALAAERLWTWGDLQRERPKDEIVRLFAPRAANEAAGAGAAPRQHGVETTALEKVLLVQSTAGALPLRVYAAHVAISWDEVAPVVERAARMSRAAAVVLVDLHEVPPASRDKAAPGKRVLAFQGDIRIAALGYEPEAVLAEDLDRDLAEARRWLAARADLGPPIATALADLPAECVVERVAASPEKLEVRLAGIRAEEADVYADRLVAAPEVAALFARPEVGREADTFIVTLGKK